MIDADGVAKILLPNGATLVMLPRAFHLEAMKEAHSSQTGGHFSVKKTLAKLRNWCTWPTMASDVAHFFAACAPCQRPFKKKSLAAQPQHIEKGGIWKTLAMDHFGPILVSANGQRKNVLVLIDMFTKYVEAFIVSSTGADEVVNSLRFTFLRHGIPESILADNGTAFISKAVSDTFASFGIHGKHSTPYNPQSNGIVERVNRTLKSSLAKYAFNNEVSVLTHLQSVVAAYNASVHSTTGYSPFYMMHHRHPSTPLSATLVNQPEVSVTDSVAYGTSNRIGAEAQASRNIAKAELAQDKRLISSGKVDPNLELNIGDKAWIFNEGSQRTFAARFDSLVTIIGKTSPNTYLVEDAAGKALPKPVNVRRLVKFIPPISDFGISIGPPHTRSSGPKYSSPTEIIQSTPSFVTLRFSEEEAPHPHLPFDRNPIAIPSELLDATLVPSAPPAALEAALPLGNLFEIDEQPQDDLELRPDIEVVPVVESVTLDNLAQPPYDMATRHLARTTADYLRSGRGKKITHDFAIHTETHHKGHNHRRGLLELASAPIIDPDTIDQRRSQCAKFIADHLSVRGGGM